MLTAPGVRVELGGPGTDGSNAAALQFFLLLTILSLVPAILMMVTSFVRIAIVLSFVRNAVGVPQLPPNQVLLGLALFLTFFVMAPTWQRINTEALQPYLGSQLPADQAFDMGFMVLVPFLVIDLVVSSVLMSMGMMMLPPATISLPFKLLLFVLADGWHLIVRSLIESFGT